MIEILIYLTQKNFEFENQITTTQICILIYSWLKIQVITVNNHISSNFCKFLLNWMMASIGINLIRLKSTNF